MKRCSIFILTCVLICIEAVAGNDVEITVKTPGSLKEQILDSDVDIIESLKVKGTLNAADLQYIGSSTGIVASIKTLDISEVSFVLDGGIYHEDRENTGSMGVVKVDKYALWPCDSSTYSVGVSTNTSVHYGNDLAAAFRGSKYEKVMLPKSLKGVGASIFRDAENLKEAVFSGKEKYIADNAFRSAKNISVLNLPATVDSIGVSAFEGACTSITVDLSRVSKFGNGCFSNAGIKAVTLPSGDVRLAESMFSNCTELTSVSCPDGIKAIPEKMFYLCTSLNNVTLGKGLVEIGRRAFYRCPIKEISLPESLRIIDDSAFFGGEFERISLPESVEVIGSAAFARCEKLASINMPESITRVGSEAFKYTKVISSFPVENSISYFGQVAYEAENYLPSHVTFRNGTIVLADGLFNVYIQSGWAWKVVESVELPSSLKHIGAEAFNGTKITEITFPDGLETIGDNAFYNLKLSKIHFPETLRKIGHSAFTNNGDGKLTSVNLPEGLEEIGYMAFSGNPITIVTLPTSLQIIGSNAFSNNSSLIKINYNCRDAKVGLPQNGSYIVNSPFYGSSCDRISFGSNVKSIPERLFDIRDNKFNVSQIELPANVVSIGEYAFNIPSLQKINLPKNLEYLGASPFGSTIINESDIPATLKYIGEGALANAEFENITLSENLEFIGFNAFNGITTNNITVNCPNVKMYSYIEYRHAPFSNGVCKSLTIGSKVKYIPPYFFYKLNGYETLTIPDGCTFSRYAFAYNDALLSVNLPEGLKSIPEAAFYYCQSLSKVNIPSTVESIGIRAFTSCKGIRNMTLPLALREIGDFAFNITPFGSEINLGPSIKKVGTYAFSSCSDVTRIFIPSQIEYIGEKAFNVSPNVSSNITVISMIENLSAVDISEDEIFTNNSKWRLRVPYGTMNAYQNSYAWGFFGEYEENDDMNINLEKGFDADFSQLSGKTFDGVVIGGIYYSFNSGVFGPAGTAFHLSGTGDIEDEDLFDILTPNNYDLTQFYQGIAIRLPAGEGHLIIGSENYHTSLTVKIAGRAPVIFDNGKLQNNVVDFNLTDDTYAYIYSNRKDFHSTIRSLKVRAGHSGIEDVAEDSDVRVLNTFTIDGLPASAEVKGIVIERLSDGTVRKVIK